MLKRRPGEHCLAMSDARDAKGREEGERQSEGSEKLKSIKRKQKYRGRKRGKNKRMKSDSKERIVRKDIGSKQEAGEFMTFLPGIDVGTKVADQEGFVDAEARTTVLSAQHRSLVATTAKRGVRVDRAARTAVVLLDSDVQRPDCTADVDGRALFAFQAVYTFGDKAETT